MGLLDVLKGRAKAAPSKPTGTPIQTAAARRVVSLEERDWETESLDGEQLTGRGYMLRDEDGIGFSFDDADLAANGYLVIRVAGTTFRPQALQRPQFTPGERVTLVRESENEYDENAVAVFDAKGKEQVGYVPKDVAAKLAKRLDSGEKLEAFSLWEWRKKSGERCALRVFIGPGQLMATLRASSALR
jgi:HIRAN domain